MRRAELKETLWATFLCLLVVAIVVVVLTALNGSLYPWWLSIQRRSVEQSKSFTDSNNLMLQTYITEHTKLEVEVAKVAGNPDLAAAYQAQQSAIITKMCMEVSTMAEGTVKPATLSWINSHGGCR